MVALHVLFASLAFLAAARESHRPHLPSSQAGPDSTGPLEAFSALWHFNEVARYFYTQHVLHVTFVTQIQERCQCAGRDNSIFFVCYHCPIALRFALPCVFCLLLAM